MSDVALLEQHFGKKLPAEYANFISGKKHKKYNGYFFRPVNGLYPPETAFKVHFYKKAVKADLLSYELPKTYQGLPKTVLVYASERIWNPLEYASYLPFANFDEPSGYIEQLLLVDISEGERCPVLLWDYEAGIKPLADSIADFLKTLIPAEELSPYNILKRKYEQAMLLHKQGDYEAALQLANEGLLPFAHVTQDALKSIDRQAPSSVYTENLYRKLGITTSELDGIGHFYNLRGSSQRHIAGKTAEAVCDFERSHACNVYQGLLNLAEMYAYDLNEPDKAIGAAETIIRETYHYKSIYLRHEGMFYVYKVFAFSLFMVGEGRKGARFYDHILKLYRSRPDLLQKAADEIDALMEKGVAGFEMLTALKAGYGRPVPPVLQTETSFEARYNSSVAGFYMISIGKNKEQHEAGWQEVESILEPLHAKEWIDIVLTEEETWYLGRLYRVGAVILKDQAAEQAVTYFRRAIDFCDLGGYEGLMNYYVYVVRDYGKARALLQEIDDFPLLRYDLGGIINKARAYLLFMDRRFEEAMEVYLDLVRRYKPQWAVTDLEQLIAEEHPDQQKAQQVMQAMWSLRRSLFEAVRDQDEAALEAALAKGVDLNYAIDSFEGYSNIRPLHFALLTNRVAAANMLLRNGARVTMDDDDSRQQFRPLHYAAMMDNEGLVTTILDAGEDVNVSIRKGKTAILMAAEKGLLGMVKLLNSRGATLNEPDVDDRTALHYAAGSGNAELVVFLLKKKVSPLLKDRQGKTALAYASTEEIRQLLN